MSNKIKTVSIGDLPIATELDDADELLLRDVSATLPENATARLSIATLRAAMGGGSPDRIESESGAAFAEATDDFEGAGGHAVVSGADANGGSGRVFAGVLPGEGPDLYTAFSQMWAGEEGNFANGVWISAYYDAETGMKGLEAEGAPLEIEEPVESNHAATKGYVDSRPGADAWSEHAATQDVDLDGHKLTGLGEPTDAADAATKGYVDGAAPAKIELAGSRVEVLPNGNIEIWRDGQRRLSIASPTLSSSIKLSTTYGSHNTSVTSGGNAAELHAFFGSGGGAKIGVESLSEGRVYLQTGVAKYFLAVNGDALPAGVESVVQAARRAYERRADVEWWEPVWTPIENVDSVSNVECSYTRTYRAAGGSLVTLEGTITVESLAAGKCAATAPVPVPVAGDPTVMGVASVLGPGGTALCDAQLVGDGSILAFGFAAEGDDVHTIAFRLSYRAA